MYREILSTRNPRDPIPFNRLTSQAKINKCKNYSINKWLFRFARSNIQVVSQKNSWNLEHLANKV